MLGETSNRLVLIGVGVSLLLHVSGAWVWYALGGEGASSDFQRPVMEDQPPDPTHRIDLGNPESRAVSMSWIGFDEYKKHVARHSEVEQPDLTMDPSAGASGAAGSVTAARDAVQQATMAARAQAERALQEMAAGLRAIGEWAKVLPEGTGRVEDVVAAGQSEARTQEREQAARAESGTPEERVAQGEKAGEDARRAQGEAGSGTVVGATGRRSAEGEHGRQDDRESDATSTTRAESWSPGQPLAARGLRIRTVKPVLSRYTSVMSGRRSPVVRIYFDASGRATRVDLVEPTGNPDIDRPVLDAVYRWTATGESLKNLGGSETVSIDVRILL